MSDSGDSSARPHPVRMGAWMVIVAGVLHVIGSFDDMRGLRTIDTRDRVDETLKAMSESGISIGRDQLLDVMHVGILVSAAAAAAAVVMGVQALRRDRVAPWVLILLSLLAIGGSVMFDPLMGMFIGVGTGLLWSGPARDWFAGREVRPSRMELAMRAASVPEGSEAQPPDTPFGSAGGPSGGTSSGPAPETGPPAGVPPQPPAPHLAPPTQGYGARPVPAVGGAPAPRVPAAVRTATMISIVFSAMTAIAAAFTMAAMVLLPRDEIRQIIEDARASDPQVQEALGNVDVAQLTAMLGVALGLIVIWCAVATALAIMTWRRHNWARALLIASAVGTAFTSLFGLPFSAVHVIAAVSVIVLLAVPASGQWFRGSRPPGLPYPGQPGYGQVASPASPPSAAPPPSAPLPPQPPSESLPPAAPQPDDPRRDEHGKPPVW